MEVAEGCDRMMFEWRKWKGSRRWRVEGDGSNEGNGKSRSQKLNTVRMGVMKGLEGMEEMNGIEVMKGMERVEARNLVLFEWRKSRK